LITRSDDLISHSDDSITRSDDLITATKGGCSVVRVAKTSDVLQGMVRPMRPLSMRKIREVLRLRYECQRSHRQIAASCDISPASVGEYLKRAQATGLEWSEVRELSEEQVEALLFRQVGYNEPPLRARPPADLCRDVRFRKDKESPA
jgi:DNA-directed RNA polymerase specialized sigma subunit